MQLDKKQHQLKQTVETLISAGCNYRLDELAHIYDPDLRIIMVQENGDVLSFDYEQNMTFFRNLLTSGAPPLDTTATFNHLGIQGEVGYVIVTRRMDLGAGPRKIVFNLMLKQSDNGWQVFREQATVVGED